MFSSFPLFSRIRADDSSEAMQRCNTRVILHTHRERKRDKEESCTKMRVQAAGEEGPGGFT